MNRDDSVCLDEQERAARATPPVVMQSLITIILVLERWPTGRPRGRGSAAAYRQYIKDREALVDARRLLSIALWDNERLANALRFNGDQLRGFIARIKEHHDCLARKERRRGR